MCSSKARSKEKGGAEETWVLSVTRKRDGMSENEKDVFFRWNAVFS